MSEIDRNRGGAYTDAMGRIPEAVASMLAEYRSRLERRFGVRLEALRLFGSVARGDSHDESDADLAVIVKNLSEDERVAAMDDAFFSWLDTGRRGPMPSALVWSETEFAALRNAELRIAEEIEREGIAV